MRDSLQCHWEHSSHDEESHESGWLVRGFTSATTRTASATLTEVGRVGSMAKWPSNLAATPQTSEVTGSYRCSVAAPLRGGGASTSYPGDRGQLGDRGVRGSFNTLPALVYGLSVQLVM